MTDTATPINTPIDRYVAEQHGGTAVERFAARHDDGLLEPGVRWFSDRLPATPPGPGQQYAFQVDLDRCTGCKSCVSACHSLNGLDAGESWRSVGLLVGDYAGSGHTQTVPTGCHHCLDPACLAGCPTNAYEKDPVTGIVAHLDDQCFGCGYCELTCPYEVPKLNHRLGIVRKCDMCAGRLATGEAPACVQACPTSAITITLVDTATVAAATRDGALVPGAPPSRITGPTTHYVSSRPTPDDLEAADRHALHLSPAHPPLAVMLVLTQLSVGAFVAALLADREGSAIAAAAAAMLALGASVFHLGRPTIAYRAVLGLRHSWLSREIVAFGAYALLATVFAVGIARPIVGPLAALVGLVGVACSAQIYVVTRRAWWRARYTFTKFGLTAAATGPLLVLATGDDAPVRLPLTWATVAATAVALADEAWFLWRGHDRSSGGSDLDRTAHLLLVRLGPATAWRFLLAAAGGIAVPLGLAFAERPGVGATVLAALALVVLVTGALIERYQFFVASVTARMPGGFRR